MYKKNFFAKKFQIFWNFFWKKVQNFNKNFILNFFFTQKKAKDTPDN